MKRLIAALGLTVLAVSASAAEYEFAPPYEQLNVDRALPQIEFAPVEPYIADARAPFEQVTLDRALPNLRAQSTQYAEAAAGGTRTDASIGAGAEADGDLPWAHDHNFIAPAP
jgi:hypothetical protein